MDTSSLPRIVFMGTPDFAVPSLDALVASGYKPIAVVTGEDKPQGRGRSVSATPIKKAALSHGIRTILQPSDVKDPEFARQVRALNPDIVVVVAFRILPPAVFEAARLGAFNLHGSLLPAFRGAAPINRAIMAGKETTGVTTFFLQQKVDTGNILLQRILSIGPDETAGEVHDRMMVLGAEVVVDTVKLILDGKAEPKPQDDSLASPAPKIFKNDCRIDWKASDEQVHNHIRGLSPFPGAWTTHADMMFKVYRSHREEESDLPQPGPPGTIHADGSILRVSCGNGVVRILELQQEGRKRLFADEFQHGHPFQAGERFE